MIQNIIVDDEECAKKCIAHLKGTNGGRATFLPVNTIKPRTLDEKGLDDCYGFIGIASELCSADPKYSGILSNLLGRIVVAVLCVAAQCLELFSLSLVHVIHYSLSIIHYPLSIILRSPP